MPTDSVAPSPMAGLRVDNVAMATGDLSAATSAPKRHGVELLWANQPLNAKRSSTMLRDPEGNWPISLDRVERWCKCA